MLRLLEDGAEDRELLVLAGEQVLAEQKLRRPGDLGPSRVVVGGGVIALLERHRKDASTFLVELLVVRPGIDLRSQEERDPAAVADVGFEIGDRLGRQLADVHEEDAGKLRQVAAFESLGRVAAAELVAPDEVVARARHRFQRGSQEEAVLVELGPASGPFAVDDEDRDLVADLDCGDARVVRFQAVVLEIAELPASEPQRDPIEERLARLDVRSEPKIELDRLDVLVAMVRLAVRREQQRHGPVEVHVESFDAHAVVEDEHVHLGVVIAEVRDACRERDRHPLAGDLGVGPEVDDADVVLRVDRRLSLRPRLVGDVDEEDLHVARVLRHAAHDLVQFLRLRPGPVAAAEIADDIELHAMIDVVADDVLHALHRLVHVGVEQRRLQVVEVVLELIELVAVGEMVVRLRLKLGVERRLGDRDQDHAIVRAHLAQVLQQVAQKNVVLGDLEAVLGSAVLLPRVAHAERVVEEDDVDVLLAAEVREVEADEAQDEQTRQGDEEAAQQQEEHLLDDEATAIALLGLEEELHCRPPDALESHPIDEMDDDRHADERGRRSEESGIQEPFDHRSSSTRRARSVSKAVAFPSFLAHRNPRRLRPCFRVGLDDYFPRVRNSASRRCRNAESAASRYSAVCRSW